MDPIAGTFVDSNRRIGRFGRFRPVMMYSSIALGILTAFTFLTPGGSEGVNLTYAYATYMVWGVAYAFTNTPYGSLASVMTQDSQERAKLASFRQGGSVGALLVTGVAFLPIARAFESQRVGYAVAASVLAFFGILAFYACFRGTREHIVAVRQHAKADAPAPSPRPSAPTARCSCSSS